MHYLRSIDYQILLTNFYCRFGEIDLITIDYSNDKAQLVFIEVKTRKTITFGSAKESLTHTKKQRLIKTALYFLNSTTFSLPFAWRIDLICLQLNQKGGLQEITHYKNIIDG